MTIFVLEACVVCGKCRRASVLVKEVVDRRTLSVNYNVQLYMMTFHEYCLYPKICECGVIKAVIEEQPS